MTGQDIIRALNDLDPEMVEAAQQCGHKKKKNHVLTGCKGMTVAVAAVICVILIRFAWQLGAQPIIVENRYVRLEDAMLLSQSLQGESVSENLEKEDAQDALPYVVKDGIVQMQFVNGEYSDALVPQLGIGTNGSTYLKKAIRELNVSEQEEELRYLVEIEIYVPHPEYPEMAWYGDNEVYAAEYERLTRECDYDLTWIPPGGYSMPEAYVYCLKCGIIYGALTEEEMNNFPINEDYSYGFRLTRYEDYKFTEYDYQESYTSMDEFIQYMRALQALQELGEKDGDE